jgi:alkylated DNA repair protein alkB family protein 8
VLHHISTEERRIRLLAESMRTLKVGGRALFYAWALEQNLSEGADKDTGVSGHDFAAPDVLVPFHLKMKGTGISLPTE